MEILSKFLMMGGRSWSKIGRLGNLKNSIIEEGGGTCIRY